MPTTPVLLLPYPAPTATPDVPYDMQQLAETVETKLSPAVDDTGWVALSTAGWTWTINDAPAYRKKAGVVYMRGNVSGYTTGAWQSLCTLPVGARPGITTYFPVSANTSATFSIEVNASTGLLRVFQTGASPAWTSLAGVTFPV